MSARLGPKCAVREVESPQEKPARFAVELQLVCQAERAGASYCTISSERIMSRAVQVLAQLTIFDNEAQASARELHVRCSIVVSISACHAEDLGSIPGGGVVVWLFAGIPTHQCATTSHQVGSFLPCALGHLSHYNASCVSAFLHQAISWIWPALHMASCCKMTFD